MKREFGKRLIESYLTTLDLTHVVDTSGAYIPGHGTPTVILFARSRAPLFGEVRTVMGIRGEPSEPQDPARGIVWTAILDQIDRANSESAFISVGDLPRHLFAKHPWSLGGGGALGVKQLIDGHNTVPLKEVTESAGIASWAGLDDAFATDRATSLRRCWSSDLTHEFVAGDTVRDWSINTTDVALAP